jgi:hypothetical protein
MLPDTGNVSSLPKNSSFSPDLEIDIDRERIRQARWGFNLVAGFVGLSIASIVVGVILFLIGNLTQGSRIAIGGFSATTVGSLCMRLYRETNDRLDRLSRDEKLKFSDLQAYRLGDRLESRYNTKEMY